jgi:hypothetical protein
MKIFVLVSFIIALNTPMIFSRATVFSGDPVKFPTELKTFMQNVTEQQDEILEEFLKAWQVDSIFSTSEQTDIIRLSQKLEDKNGRPYPHFIHLLSCYLLIKEKNLSASNYENWLSGMEYYLDARKSSPTLLDQLLEFTINLLTENAIYKSASTTWKIKGPSYTFIAENGLYADVSETELVCYIRTDSLNIYNTSGRVDPANMQWQGVSGLVTWERGGYPRDQVFAKLKEYTISLNKSEYSAKDVVFTNNVYLKETLKGDLEDKVKHIQEPDDATYPQFFSYTKTFNIKNLYKDVDYTGGLSMQGAKLVGRGTMESPAHLFIFRKDTLVLEATSFTVYLPGS